MVGCRSGLIALSAASQLAYARAFLVPPPQVDARAQAPNQPALPTGQCQRSKRGWSFVGAGWGGRGRRRDTCVLIEARKRSGLVGSSVAQEAREVERSEATNTDTNTSTSSATAVSSSYRRRLIVMAKGVFRRIQRWLSYIVDIAAPRRLKELHHARKVGTLPVIEGKGIRYL